MRAGSLCLWGTFLLPLWSGAAVWAGSAVEAAASPNMELLEFLGEWETDDGQWVDPMSLYREPLPMAWQNGTGVEAPAERKRMKHDR